MGNPSLGEVKTMIIGVRNLSSDIKSGEVWVNELRLQEYNNEGGWAAQGNLNVQFSDFGTVNVQGRYITEGFGGLEEGVMQRSMEDQKSYSVTTSFELGKFFPDKAKVTAPIYYSVTKESNSPKYTPLDTDMRLKDALDALESKRERDSLENIAVSKSTTTNFSLSNVRQAFGTLQENQEQVEVLRHLEEIRFELVATERSIQHRDFTYLLRAAETRHGRLGRF